MITSPPPPACAHKLPSFLGGAPLCSQPLKWFCGEELLSLHQHVQRVEQKRRRDVLIGYVPGRAVLLPGPLLGTVHVGEIGHGSNSGRLVLLPLLHHFP